MKKLLVFILSLTSIFFAKAQNISIAYPNAAWGAGQYLGIVKYVHPSHVGGTKDPVIIWLHGNGGASNYNSTLTSAAKAAADNLYLSSEDGLPKRIQGGMDISSKKANIGSNPLEHFVVLAPAQDIDHDGFVTGINGNYVNYCKQYIRDSLTSICDTNRIYVVGWSGGGTGVWGYPTTSLANAQSIAAIVPIAGVCISPADTWCDIATANLPVWAFHANNDGTVSSGCSSGAVSSINNTCGAAIPALYKNPATGGHTGIVDTALNVANRYSDPSGVIAPTTSMNIYEWMLQYDLSIVSPSYPAGQRITVDQSLVFDVTQARKRPDLLFDNDTLTYWTSDNLNGYILAMTGGQQTWIVLDSFINYPRIKIFNGPFSGGTNVSVQFFYDYTDTTRHSNVFTTTLSTGIWKYVDSLNSRSYSDSVRLIRLSIASGTADNFAEVRVYGTRLAKAPSIYPTSTSIVNDPGIYLQGYGKLYPDSVFDDAGYSLRDQNDMDWLDTCTINGNGKVLTLNIFGNHSDLFYAVAKRHNRRIHSYFSGPRKFFKYSDNNTKDIPIGSDSTLLSSWAGTDSLYYGIVAKFGFNTSAPLTGYTYINCPAGAGLGTLTDSSQEVGNEDDARWVSALRFHTPLVKLMKIKAGYNGIKRADPNIKVITGALTGIDTSYMKAMYIENLIAFKTKVVPWDIMATNHYSTNSGVQASPGSDGVSPEQDRLWLKARGVIGVAIRFGLGAQYCTEFGYDIFDGSNYDVPVISGQTREQTKAYWIMRAYEIFAAEKWSRLYQYTQRNLGGGDFSTTGFSTDIFCVQKPVDTLPSYMHQFIDPSKLNSNNVWITIPIDLYWYMTCRAISLKNYKGWPTTIQNGDSTGVWILKYNHLTRSDSVVYAIWKGTHTNSTTSSYSVSIPQVQSASIRQASVGTKGGTLTSLSTGTNSVTVPTVNEGVQYIEAKLATTTTRNYFRGNLKNNKFKNAP